MVHKVLLIVATANIKNNQMQLLQQTDDQRSYYVRCRYSNILKKDLYV